MNQLVVVDKPKGLSSRDVVNKLNRILGEKRIGHTGTLDPLATGVLVCLLGKYTKLVDLITSYDKVYEAEIKLGIKTDTGDITGQIVDENKKSVSLEDIKKVFENFPKKYVQTVPNYSAVKVNGKRLYQYARENSEVILPTREVIIYNLELISYNNDLIKFRTKVSKGTYIRSLIEDICNKLNTVGTMNNLRRIAQGRFEINNAYSLEDIETGKFLGMSVLDFLDYPVVKVADELKFKIINGNKIPDEWQIKDKVIFTYQDREIAIYEKSDETLKPYIMF